MIHFEPHVTSTFGLLLGIALLGGVLADFLRIPKVTAYLLMGMVLGPSLFDVIPQEQIEWFDPMLKLAMALVLFNLGSQFTIARVRQTAATGLRLSAGELLATFLFVALGLMTLQISAPTALILGCLALATAPATTVLVMQELDSDGPVTRNAGLLVALNNFASIVSFEIAFLLVELWNGDGSRSIANQLLIVARDVGGSIMLGLGAGVILSYSCGLLKRKRWLVLLVALGTFLMGICQSLGVPYLLTFLTMGVAVANASGQHREIRDELDNLTGLLSVLFFAVHGAELNIHDFIAAGSIGVAYIVLRMAGKYIGTYTAARIAKSPPEVRNWLGTSLMAQAGAAIALSTIAVERNPELGRPIQTIILGTVVVFELIGPLLIRHSLLRAGEVPIDSAVVHASRSIWDQLREVSDGIRLAFRRRHPLAHSSADDEAIQGLIRPASGIPRAATFESVIGYIERSHENTFPVVDESRKLVGLIRYASLSSVMFDNSVNELARAEDLAVPAPQQLCPQDALQRAIELFQKTTDDCIPVVQSYDDPKLVGILRRSDVVHRILQADETSNEQ
ncbi:MAG: cation:proton antiporter [Pirellulaceae bacterium]|nr:cation:proton antiporter [Planctomycetales bacterium]